MSEIRLICPGCDAEYRLPPGAIPAGGREVECSACGHVWTATQADLHGRRLDLSRFAAPVMDRPRRDRIEGNRLASDRHDDDPHDVEGPDSDRPDSGRFDSGRSDSDGPGSENRAPDSPRPLIPPPSSKLAPNLLDLLREEVEHERRLRAAEAQDQRAAGPEGDEPKNAARQDAHGLEAARDDAGVARPIDDTEWPATTVTAAPRDAAPSAAPSAAPQGASSSVVQPPQVIRHIPTSRPQDSGEPEREDLLPGAAARNGKARRDTAGTDRATLPAPGPERNAARGYRSGFGLAVMVAGILVAIYLLAPSIAESDHAIGAPLLEFRAEIDRLRSWLGEQAAQLLGRA